MMEAGGEDKRTVPSFVEDANSPSVTAHLEIMQGIISRMANNSATAKTWCVTLVAAILLLVAYTGRPAYSLIALLPIGLFLFLDAYYLQLERRYIQAYERFVERLHAGTLHKKSLYKVEAAKRGWLTKLGVVTSPSIWPFYGCLIAAVGILYAVSDRCG